MKQKPDRNLPAPVRVAILKPASQSLAQNTVSHAPPFAPRCLDL